jgi:hypothetical protein
VGARWEVEMRLGIVVGLVLGASWLAAGLPSGVAAQPTVHVQVDVHVEAPPPGQVVVVEAEPPPSMLVLVEEEHAAPPQHEPAPAPAPEPAPSTRRSIEPMLFARGEMYLSDEYGMAGLGGAAGVGGSLGREWGGAVVVGYLGELGGGRSEVHLGLEVTKDFDPTGHLGFYVLFGMGAAFVSADPDRGIDLLGGPRMMAQFGVGARMNVVDERVAITLDGRGVLRYALPDAHDLESDGSVSGGAMLTLGLAIRL